MLMLMLMLVLALVLVIEIPLANAQRPIAEGRHSARMAEVLLA